MVVAVAAHGAAECPFGPVAGVVRSVPLPATWACFRRPVSVFVVAEAGSAAATGSGAVRYHRAGFRIDFRDWIGVPAYEC